MDENKEWINPLGLPIRPTHYIAKAPGRELPCECCYRGVQRLSTLGGPWMCPKCYWETYKLAGKGVIPITFYVNSFRDDSKGSSYHKTLFGLFTNNDREGRGNSSGYWGLKYYKDTALLAYFLTEGDTRDVENPRISEFISCDEWYDKVPIHYGGNEREIEANDIEEARLIFQYGLYL